MKEFNPERKAHGNSKARKPSGQRGTQRYGAGSDRIRSGAQGSGDAEARGFDNPGESVKDGEQRRARTPGKAYVPGSNYRGGSSRGAPFEGGSRRERPESGSDRPPWNRDAPRRDSSDRDQRRGEFDPRSRSNSDSPRGDRPYRGSDREGAAGSDGGAERGASQRHGSRSDAPQSSEGRFGSNSDRRPQRGDSRSFGDRGQRSTSREENSTKEVTNQRWGALAARGAAHVRPLDPRSGIKTSDESNEPKYTQPDPIESWVPTPGKPEAAKPAEKRKIYRNISGSVGYNVEEIVLREAPKGLSTFRANQLRRDLAESVRAYESDRYKDAKRLLESIRNFLPHSPSIAELLGLTYYRLGSWKLALELLEASTATSGSLDQAPVMADCYRALQMHDRVAQLYEDVGRVSPSAEVMAEARIVYAGSMSDQKNYADAIALLSKFEDVKRRTPRLIDLRQWYVLADLYEKTGELEHARALFLKVAREDAGLYDVAERLADLR